jgi:hypothetical protein
MTGFGQDTTHTSVVAVNSVCAVFRRNMGSVSIRGGHGNNNDVDGGKLVSTQVSRRRHWPPHVSCIRNSSSLPAKRFITIRVFITPVVRTPASVNKEGTSKIIVGLPPPQYVHLRHHCQCCPISPQRTPSPLARSVVRLSKHGRNFPNAVPSFEDLYSLRLSLIIIGSDYR